MTETKENTREISYFTLKFSKDNEEDIILDASFDTREFRTFPDITVGEPAFFGYRNLYPTSALQHIRNCINHAKEFGYRFDGFVRNSNNKLEKLNNEQFLLVSLYGFKNKKDKF